MSDPRDRDPFHRPGRAHEDEHVHDPDDKADAYVEVVDVDDEEEPDRLRVPYSRSRARREDL